MSTVRAALVYFALVMGAGFVLGIVRVPLLVPRIGERWAELAEMPVMCAVVFVAAGCMLRWFPDVRRPGRSLIVGLLALALMIAAELGLAAVLQERSVGEYLAGRDRISGSAYLAVLIVFALMPRLRLSGQKPGSREGRPASLRMPSWLPGSMRRRPDATTLLNDGLGLAMDWGDSWLAPINARMRALHPSLSVHELEELNVACQGAMRLGCETVHTALLSGPSEVPTVEALAQVVRRAYPWIDDANLARLRNQGIYYAAKVGVYARKA